MRSLDLAFLFSTGSNLGMPPRATATGPTCRYSVSNDGSVDLLRGFQGALGGWGLR